MGYVFIIFFVLSFFIVTFALLHLLAGGAALLKGDKTTGNILVLQEVSSHFLQSRYSQCYLESHSLHGSSGPHFAAWERTRTEKKKETSTNHITLSASLSQFFSRSD